MVLKLPSALAAGKASGFERRYEDGKAARDQEALHEGRCCGGAWGLHPKMRCRIWKCTVRVRCTYAATFLSYETAALSDISFSLRICRQALYTLSAVSGVVIISVLGVLLCKHGSVQSGC